MRQAARHFGSPEIHRILESAVAAIQDVVMVCELDSGRIMVCNPVVQRAFGYTPDELLGETPKCLFPDADSYDEYTEFVAEALRRWGHFSTDLELQRADGELFDAEIRVLPLTADIDGKTCTVVTIRDVSHSRGADQAVRESMEHMQSTLNSLQEAVLTIDPETRTILTANLSAERMFGYSVQDVLGRSTRYFYADDAQFERVGEEYSRALESHGVYQTVLTAPHRDGHPVTVEVTMTALSPRLGWREGVVASMRDITDQKQAEQRARLAESVLEYTVEAVVITDLDHRIVAVNPAFEKVTGHRAKDVYGKSPDILRSGRHPESFHRDIWRRVEQQGYWQGEIWQRRKSGELFPAMASTSVVRDESGEISHYTNVFTDITQHKHIQEQLDYLLRYDPLTGLPNRASFENLVDTTVSRDLGKKESLAVLFLDIDQFTTVNETLGHAVGDSLLKTFTKRLRASLGEGALIARLGGDEFGIILSRLTDTRQAAQVAKRLLEDLQMPLKVEGHELYPNASIGISCLPDDGRDSRALMRCADSALSRAKELGGNCYQFFSRELNLRAFETLVMVSSLRQALERDQMQLYFQPRVGAADGRIIGAEALIRWHHPDLGLTLPGQFITLAEQTGLIGMLGDWVLRSALDTLIEWRSRNLPELPVAVNLSARQFDDPDLINRLRETLAERKLERSAIEVEITESALMTDPARAEETLRSLRASGVNVMIDDFGTGYSSLSYLKQFPISGLKIDRSFIHGIPDSPDDTAITKAIVAMAASLDLRLVAEGVETPEQAEFLRNLGCHELQGFLYSVPVPADEFADMLLNPVLSPRKLKGSRS